MENFINLTEGVNFNILSEGAKIEVEVINEVKYAYFKPILEDLSQGSRIAFARQIRLMSQDDLAFYLNLEGENRRRTVTRYEKNDRAPKDDRLEEISKILKVNINSIKNYDFLNKYDELYLFLWMEELYPNTFSNFELDENHLSDPVLKKFNKEWKEMREKRKNHLISYNDYVEWKLNYSLEEECMNEENS